MKKNLLVSKTMQSHQLGQSSRTQLYIYARLIGLTIILLVFVAACSQQPEFPTGVFEFAQQRITFNPDGSYTVWHINIESFDVEDGRYTIDGNQITFQDETEDCELAIGKYTWEFDGEKLLFEPTEDECEGRKDSLSKSKWFIKP